MMLIGALIKAIYYIFFGWWFDQKLSRRIHDDLVRDVYTWLGFLFTDYGAKIIPNDQEPPALFDFALVTLSVGDLIFRIFRGRGRCYSEGRLIAKSKRLPRAVNPTERNGFWGKKAGMFSLARHRKGTQGRT